MTKRRTQIAEVSRRPTTLWERDFVEPTGLQSTLSDITTRFAELQGVDTPCSFSATIEGGRPVQGYRTTVTLEDELRLTEILQERSGDFLVTVVDTAGKTQYFLTKDGLAHAATEGRGATADSLKPILDMVNDEMTVVAADAAAERTKRTRRTRRLLGVAGAGLASLVVVSGGAYTIATADSRARQAMDESGYSLPASDNGTVTGISKEQMERIPGLKDNESISRPRKINLTGGFFEDSACATVPTSQDSLRIVVSTDGADVVPGATSTITQVGPSVAKICVPGRAIKQPLDYNSVVAVQEVPAE